MAGDKSVRKRQGRSGMVRAHAITASAAGLVPFGHLGWAYHDRNELLSRAAEYIGDGLRLNQRVAYVGESSPEVLRAEHPALPSLREPLESGRIHIAATTDYYVFCPGPDVLDSDAPLRKYIVTAEDAL